MRGENTKINRQNRFFVKDEMLILIADTAKYFSQRSAVFKSRRDNALTALLMHCMSAFCGKTASYTACPVVNKHCMSLGIDTVNEAQ